MPNELLAVTANTSSYQIKNKEIQVWRGCDFTLFEQFSTQQLAMGHFFHYLYEVLLA